MKGHTLFDYDHTTGILSWKKTSAKVTCKNRDGYVVLKVENRQYRAHRIIWDMFNPDDLLRPGEQIDHINHDRSDNRLCNLRKVTASENHRNTKLASNNRSGVTGVYWFQRAGKWKGTIKVNGKNVHLGYFDDLSTARAAQADAENKYGFHDNHGKIK